MGDRNLDAGGLLLLERRDAEAGGSFFCGNCLLDLRSDGDESSLGRQAAIDGEPLTFHERPNISLSGTLVS